MDQQISKIVEDLASAPREAWLWSERIELEDLNFTEFEIADGGRIAAVDGSSGIAEPSGGLYLGMVRAGYVLYGEKREKSISPIEIFPIGFHNAVRIYEERFREILGESPPPISDADPKYILQRIRTLEEYRQIFSALDRLEEGDVLLVDGALRGDRHTPDIAIRILSERAQDKGVSVVGISKNSGLSMSGLPLIPMIWWEAESTGFGRWFVRISGKVSGGKEEIYVVRYNPASESAFRTDTISLESPATVFGKVARYCADVSYLGYPYPLADIHNEVIIRGGVVEDIASRFRLEMMRKGLDSPENFHRKLDRGV